MANPESPWKALSLVSILGIDLAVGVLLGVWLGRKWDDYLGTAPWGVVCGVFLGMGVGVLIIIPIVKKFLGEQNK